MKKITSTFFALLLGISLTFAQPISDMGIIPIGVTLNSILRLNIVSGGNIEFVVNNISQYTTGVSNSAQYQTNFTVASSIDFDVAMYAEEANLIGVDDPTNHQMNLNNIGYLIANNGTGAVPGDYVIAAISSGGAANVDALTNGSVDVIAGVDGNAAGDVLKNDFTIQWELATGRGAMPALPANSLLTQSLAADRYVVNVVLILSEN